MKVLRVLLLLVLLSGVALLAALNWVQTPAGAEALSKWLTRQVQETAPGSRIELEEVRPQWPPAVTFQRADWIGGDGRPVLVLTRGKVSLRKLQWPVDRFLWKGAGNVDRLDLAALDRASGKGQWKAAGFMRGKAGIRGKGRRIQDLQLSLEAEPPGGQLNSEVLSRLAEMMPPGDTRGILLRALGAKETFHYDVGRLELSTEKGLYLLNLLLDGDHLLDLKIRFPQDGIKFLKENQLWK